MPLVHLAEASPLRSLSTLLGRLKGVMLLTDAILLGIERFRIHGRMAKQGSTSKRVVERGVIDEPQTRSFAPPDVEKVLTQLAETFAATV